MTQASIQKLSDSLFQLSERVKIDEQLTLMTFLGRLLTHLRVHCHMPGISRQRLTEILNTSLCCACTAVPVARRDCVQEYFQFETTLKRQVSDLESFESTAKLQDLERSFGFESHTRAGRDNFSTDAFLGAAAACLAAQPPATLPRVCNNQQMLTTARTQSLDADIQILSWELVELLLVLGRIYE